jgi:uncharacterized membrane protein YfcA
LNTTTVISLTLLFLGAAMLYSAVGQAGASGYIAVMGLLSIDPAIMKPTAFILNILVATIATVKYYQAGRFSWSVFWPFVVTSVPFSFVGGSLPLSGAVYKVLVGLVLLYASFRLFRSAQIIHSTVLKPLPMTSALLAGVVIGLLSGITGTGGGIFLTPLLLVMGWADATQVQGISAAFILVNSLAGLAGQLAALSLLPAAIPLWLLASAVGGWIGAEYGIRQNNKSRLQQLLAVVLAIAGLKLIFL